MKPQVRAAKYLFISSGMESIHYRKQLWIFCLNVNKLQYWTIIYRHTFTGVLISKTTLGLQWKVLIIHDTGKFRKHLFSHFLLPPLCWWTSRHGFEKLSHQVWIGLELVHLQLKCFSNRKYEQVCLLHRKRKCTTILWPDQQIPRCVQPQTWQQPPSALRRCAGLPTPYKVKLAKTLLWLRKLLSLPTPYKVKLAKTLPWLRKLPCLLRLPYFHLAHRLTRHSRQVSTVSESQSTS